MRKCGAVGLDGGSLRKGGPWVVSPASAFSVGGRTLRARARARARGRPPGGDRAHSEVGSKVHENCRLWAFLPAPAPAPPQTACDARFRFRTRRASISFSFPFSLLSWLSARAYLPRSDCGELGNRGPGRRNGKKQGISAFLMRTNVPANAECTCAGNGIAREAVRCRCSSPSPSLSLSHGKKKRELERKRKKKIHYRAP